MQGNARRTSQGTSAAHFTVPITVWPHTKQLDYFLHPGGAQQASGMRVSALGPPDLELLRQCASASAGGGGPQGDPFRKPYQGLDSSRFLLAPASTAAGAPPWPPPPATPAAGPRRQRFVLLGGSGDDSGGDGCPVAGLPAAARRDPHSSAYAVPIRLVPSLAALSSSGGSRDAMQAQADVGIGGKGLLPWRQLPGDIDASEGGSDSAADGSLPVVNRAGCVSSSQGVPEGRRSQQPDATATAALGDASQLSSAAPPAGSAGDQEACSPRALLNGAYSHEPSGWWPQGAAEGPPRRKGPSGAKSCARRAAAPLPDVEAEEGQQGTAVMAGAPSGGDGGGGGEGSKLGTLAAGPLERLPSSSCGHGGSPAEEQQAAARHSPTAAGPQRGGPEAHGQPAAAGSGAAPACMVTPAALKRPNGREGVAPEASSQGASKREATTGAALLPPVAGAATTHAAGAAGDDTSPLHGPPLIVSPSLSTAMAMAIESPAASMGLTGLTGLTGLAGLTPGMTPGMTPGTTGDTRLVVSSSRGSLSRPLLDDTPASGRLLLNGLEEGSSEARHRQADGRRRLSVEFNEAAAALAPPGDVAGAVYGHAMYAGGGGAAGTAAGNGGGGVGGYCDAGGGEEQSEDMLIDLGGAEAGALHEGEAVLMVPSPARKKQQREGGSAAAGGAAVAVRAGGHRGGPDLLLGASAGPPAGGGGAAQLWQGQRGPGLSGGPADAGWLLRNGPFTAGGQEERLLEGAGEGNVSPGPGWPLQRSGIASLAEEEPCAAAPDASGGLLPRPSSSHAAAAAASGAAAAAAAGSAQPLSAWRAASAAAGQTRLEALMQAKSSLQASAALGDAQQVARMLALLAGFPMTFDLLKQSQIAGTVRELRTFPSPGVPPAALSLMQAWRSLVSASLGPPPPGLQATAAAPAAAKGAKAAGARQPAAAAAGTKKTARKRKAPPGTMRDNALRWVTGVAAGDVGAAGLAPSAVPALQAAAAAPMPVCTQPVQAPTAPLPADVDMMVKKQHTKQAAKPPAPGPEKQQPSLPAAPPPRRPQQQEERQQAAGTALAVSSAQQPARPAPATKKQKTKYRTPAPRGGEAAGVGRQAEAVALAAGRSSSRLSPAAQAQRLGRSSTWADAEVEIFLDVLKEYGLDYAKLEDALPHRSHDQLRAFYTSHRRSLELDALLVKQGHVAPGSRAGRPSKRSLAAAGLAEQEGTAGDDAEDFLE